MYVLKESIHSTLYEPLYTIKLILNIPKKIQYTLKIGDFWWLCGHPDLLSRMVKKHVITLFF